MPTDRVAKIIAMASAQIGNGFNPDAVQTVSMPLARLTPGSEFDSVVKLGTQIEQRQFRLASNRVTSGQIAEDSRPIHHSYARDLAML
jgi:hypothetical protein